MHFHTLSDLSSLLNYIPTSNTRTCQAQPTAEPAQSRHCGGCLPLVGSGWHCTSGHPQGSRAPAGTWTARAQPESTGKGEQQSHRATCIQNHLLSFEQMCTAGPLWASQAPGAGPTMGRKTDMLLPLGVYTRLEIHHGHIRYDLCNESVPDLTWGLAGFTLNKIWKP